MIEVTIERLGSIMLYIAISVLTCLMAKGVSDYNYVENIKLKSRVCYTRGQRTRQSFNDRVYIVFIFIVLFVLSAFRFDVGNDYWNYINTAHEAYVGGYVVTEIGFNYLVKIIYTICGFECYEMVFAVFAAITIGIFLKVLYQQSVSFKTSFFLFMTMGLYFQTYNTVRYYLALSIALYSMRFVLDRDYIKFVFCIIIAALFHKSVLLVIPVYIIATYEWKKKHLILGLVASIVCFLAKSIVLKLALILYPSYKDTIYLEGGTSVSSIVKIMVVLLLYIWFVIYTKHKGKSESVDDDISSGVYKEIRFYAQLNMLAFVATTFFSFLPVVTRIAYYFSVSQLFMIPLIIECVVDKEVKKKVKTLVIIICIIYFLLFLLQAHKAGVGLLPYKTWLFEGERYTDTVY